MPVSADEFRIPEIAERYSRSHAGRASPPERHNPWPSPELANLFSAKSPGKVMNSFENLAGDPSKLSGRRGSKKLVWLGRGVERGGSSCLRMKPREEVEDDDDNDEKGEEEEEEESAGG